MQSLIGRQFRRISWLCAIVLLLGFIAKPSTPAFAQTGLLIPGIVNEASTLPTNSFGYQEFREVTRQFDYTGGIVCVSSSETSCQSLQIDDGIKIWVNGTKLGNADDYLSRTQPVGPFYIQNQLNPGANSIRVVLYDVQGQYRGGSPVYLTTLPDGTWYGNCTTKPISVTPFQTDYEVSMDEGRIPGVNANAGPILDVSLVYDYSVIGDTCSFFNATTSDRVDADGYTGHGWDLSGQINGASFDLGIGPRGDVTSAGIGIPISDPSGPSYFSRSGAGQGFLIDLGERYTRTIGNASNYGINLTEQQEVAARFRDKAPPPNFIFDHVPDLNELKFKQYDRVFMVVGIIGATIIAKRLGFVMVIGTTNLDEMLTHPRPSSSIQALRPAVYSKMALPSSTSTIVNDTVSSSVQDAVKQRLGPLSEFLTLSNITTRDRVSAYTELAYDADGFTPNGIVLVTFGPPDGAHDLIRQVLRADSTGHIHASLVMPDPAKVTYGTYVLIASDYESAADSAYGFVEDPEHTTINMKAAAALVDVVPDVTPPVTTAYATGPLDTNKVFRDTVTVKLAATDDLSGVHHSEYSLNNGQSWASIPNNGTFTISGSGVTAFLYRSVDKYGNVEAAKNSGPIVINKYVAFANGTGNSLSFDRNNGVTITGDIRGNGGAILTSNINLRLNGTMTTVGSVTSSGNIGTTVPAQTGPATPMLSYPMAMYQQAATHVYNGDLTINSAATQLSGLYYVNGNINISAAKVVGKVTLVATGNIVDTSTSSSITNTDPNNGIVYYAGGNITISSAKNTNLGMAYAPSGTITLNRPAGGTWKGSLVANAVVFSRAGSFTVVYNPGFTSGTYQLPLANPLW